MTSNQNEDYFPSMIQPSVSVFLTEGDETKEEYSTSNRSQIKIRMENGLRNIKSTDNLVNDFTDMA